MLYCFHGTDNEEFQAYVGLCLTQCELSAGDYGGNIFPLWLNLDGLRVVDANHLVDRENQNYPGDRNPCELASEIDADVIFYDDETCRGRSHDTWRLLTPAAVAAVEVR